MDEPRALGPDGRRGCTPGPRPGRAADHEAAPAEARGRGDLPGGRAEGSSLGDRDDGARPQRRGSRRGDHGGLHRHPGRIDGLLDDRRLRLRPLGHHRGRVHGVRAGRGGRRAGAGAHRLHVSLRPAAAAAAAPSDLDDRHRRNADAPGRELHRRDPGARHAQALGRRGGDGLPRGEGLRGRDRRRGRVSLLRSGAGRVARAGRGRRLLSVPHRRDPLCHRAGRRHLLSREGLLQPVRRARGGEAPGEGGEPEDAHRRRDS